MADCIPNVERTKCGICGDPWTDNPYGFHRTCTGEPLADHDFAAAIAELPLLVPPKQTDPLGRKIERWIRAGKPRRSDEEVQAIIHTPCEKRNPGGITCMAASPCMKKRLQEHAGFPCAILAQLATETCPEGHFHATS